MARTGRAAPEKADAVATEAASRTPLNIVNLFCSFAERKINLNPNPSLFRRKMHLLKRSGGFGQ